MKLADLGRNVRWGLTQGVVFAVIACVTVTLFEIPRWQMYREQAWLVMGIYFASAIGAGAIVGVLRPLTRHLIGAMLVGIVAAIPFGLVGSTISGSTSLKHIDWTFIAIIALPCGPLAGAIRWSQTWGRSRKNPS